MSKPRTSWHTFIEAHELCHSHKEVSDRLGITVSAVKSREKKGRDLGINLKDYPEPPRKGLNVDELNAFLQSQRDNPAADESSLDILA